MIVTNLPIGTRTPLAWIWMLCLATGCTSSERTHPDRLLLTTLQHVILANETARGYALGGQVVQTKILSTRGSTRTEQWIVKRGDQAVVYTVILHTSLGGETEYEVILPEADRERT